MSARRHIEDLRQRLGLAADDTSRDEHIENMTPAKRFEMLCGWHLGYSGWDSTILSWLRDCGFEITEPKAAPNPVTPSKGS